MKFRIGICDDDKEQIALITNYLLELKKDFEIKVISSTDPRKFLTGLKKFEPDLVFLDIDMENLDGIKLGKKIKEKDSDIIIIYITAYEKYALDAFQVRAFHYLVKPITPQKFFRVFKEAAKLFKKNNKTNRFYTVKKKGEYRKIAYKDIFYFEKIGHKIKICTKTGEVFFYQTFKKLMPELDMDFFIRCHQGYIVNISKVKAYRNQKLLLDEDLKEIPVSRSHIKDVKEMMEKRLFS